MDKTTIIYHNDNPYHTLDELQEVVSDAWRDVEPDQYIDDDGNTMKRPPVNKPIIIKSLHDELVKKVKGYRKIYG